MLVVTRFRQPPPAFLEEAQRVVAWWSAQPGCQQMQLVRNLDDQELWAIVASWESVGAYRRSFSGYEAKLTLTPLLSLALDEPTAYLNPDELGQNMPRSN